MSDKSFVDACQEASLAFNEAMKSVEDDQESWWNSLTEEQRIDAFCCVSRRIYQGDVKENRSYRGVLYDLCGFGPGAYAVAQCAGYLSIHNLIGSGMDYEQMLGAKRLIVESDTENFEFDFSKRSPDFSYNQEDQTLTIKKKPLAWYENANNERGGEGGTPYCKYAPKKPMSEEEMRKGSGEWAHLHNIFEEGIRFAEKYHNITGENYE